MKTYLCPVCGYDELQEPPEDHAVCPSCGTQFGYDDAQTSHAELRQDWVAAGCPWWSETITPPAGWSPEKQLERVTHGSSVA